MNRALVVNAAISWEFITFLLEGFCSFALLAAQSAAKDAGLAFIGAQRRSLTGKARG